jgi:hypothetical protein
LRADEQASRDIILQDEIDSASRLQQLGIDQDNRLQIATLKQREDLQNVGLDVRAKLLDSRLQFKQDERGRKFSNDRQMADYIAATATSREDFNSKMSQMQQMQERKILLLKQTQAQLETALERGFLKEQDDLDQQSKMELSAMIAANKRQIKREEARARNRQGIFTAGATILGAGIATVFGTPAAAPVGAVVGGATGSLLDSATGGLF